MDGLMSVEGFQKNLDAIIAISDRLYDGWKMMTIGEATDNNKYIIKKQTNFLTNPQDENDKIIAIFEYHVAFSISYGVPVLCFNIWKQNGALITLEEYLKYNDKITVSDMFQTLTQMDHPVLNKPVYTLHPCRTQEIMQPFMENSKNPVISWLSVVSPFVNLDMLDDYLNSC